MINEWLTWFERRGSAWLDLSTYGTDIVDYYSWQELCEEFGHLEVIYP
ncbi:hypothetical protein [Fodinicola feengrottensis]|nr:hypothetical protein [Fodinicola feengrottensis]